MLDARHVAMVELLFFAYRDFTAEADALLVDLGFGRAHHRVLHFVNRNPGLRVADLLGILKITKQSLARVLKQLVDQGYIRQTAGATDRRERRLHVTNVDGRWPINSWRCNRDGSARHSRRPVPRRSQRRRHFSTA